MSNRIEKPTLENIFISQVFDYYHQCYCESEWAEDFVNTSNRIPEKQRYNKRIGLCDRTLGNILPKARSLEGGAIRGGLKHVGLITKTGGELFRGCIVFPIFDDTGQIIEATGYRFANRIRLWQQKEIFWAKPKDKGFVLQGINYAKEMICGKTNH